MDGRCIGAAHMWGVYPYIVRDPEKWRESTKGEKAWDPHLRSTHDVSGYHIQAADGEIGHVEDFIIDDETWAIRYLVIDTRNWWPGKKVLVSPQWIERVSWDESKVFVNLSRETIKQSPEYTEESLLTRDYETGLHRHYNRQGYWVDEPAAKEHPLTRLPPRRSRTCLSARAGSQRRNKRSLMMNTRTVIAWIAVKKSFGSTGTVGGSVRLQCVLLAVSFDHPLRHHCLGLY